MREVANDRYRRGAPRILILTASVGEGHDLPARTLAAQLRAERPDAEIVTEDSLASMGRLVRFVSADAGKVVFFRFQWLWDLGFWFFAGNRATRRLTQAALTRAAGNGLLALIERIDPDAVVSTYPNTTEVLGRLRSAGRVSIPVCAVITDVAGMHYWASRGADIHLITHPESVDEVRIVAGDDARIVCVHGLTAPEFLLTANPADARGSLGLPAGGQIVLVSGGGWGVGDVAGAVDEALALESVSAVVCLCGHNTALLDSMKARFADDPRVRAEAFTSRMADWMAAADVLVHSTGGLTVLEALMRGIPAISYGWGRGHLRANNAAFRRFGLADVVATRSELGPAIARALARGRTRTSEFQNLPSAASVVLAEISRTRRQTER